MGDQNDAFMRNQNAAVQARTKAQNRANVLQLKLIGQSHPTGLTPNLLKLFEARPPLEFKPPPEKRKCPPYTGMAQFVDKFALPTDPEYSPPVKEVETPAQKKARIHQLRLEKGAAKAAEELEKFDPNNDPNASGDPYKTLFVARLSYETTESRLKREFETYGPIKRVSVYEHPLRGSGYCLVTSVRAVVEMKCNDSLVKLAYDPKSNKPRGYAFIEYAHNRDMKAAYKQADGRKIDGRRVLVDVERGRTVPNWRPRRLGGGLGTTRVGGEDDNQKNSVREVQPIAPSRSQEPRARDDREREKSRERGGREREKEVEKSRERSHDRPRDRDHREDRHHRDRDRTRDKERERDHSTRERGDREHRDRDRTRDRDGRRDHGRDYERDRDHRDHRSRDRERDYEVAGEEEYEYRGHSHDKEYEYDNVDSKHERNRHSERRRGYEYPEDDQVMYDPSEHGHRQIVDDEYERKHYDNYQSRKHQPDEDAEHDRYAHYPDRYDQTEEAYNDDRAE
ncbi:hypothetical protein V2J09_001893 [Rumex salicifolius]